MTRCDLAALEEALQGADVVVHLAFMCSSPLRARRDAFSLSLAEGSVTVEAREAARRNCRRSRAGFEGIPVEGHNDKRRMRSHRDRPGRRARFARFGVAAHSSGAP